MHTTFLRKCCYNKSSNTICVLYMTPIIYVTLPLLRETAPYWDLCRTTIKAAHSHPCSLLTSFSKHVFFQLLDGISIRSLWFLRAYTYNYLFIKSCFFKSAGQTWESKLPPCASLAGCIRVWYERYTLHWQKREQLAFKLNDVKWNSRRIRRMYSEMIAFHLSACNKVKE